MEHLRKKLRNCGTTNIPSLDLITVQAWTKELFRIQKANQYSGGPQVVVEYIYTSK